MAMDADKADCLSEGDTTRALALDDGTKSGMETGDLAVPFDDGIVFIGAPL